MIVPSPAGSEDPELCRLFIRILISPGFVIQFTDGGGGMGAINYYFNILITFHSQFTSHKRENIIITRVI